MSSQKKKATKAAAAPKPQSAPPGNASPATAWIAAVSVLLGALLLFSQLGHYAIWDDEAMIALAAKGVLKTGDTLMQPDSHNLVAYRNGSLLRDLHDRSTPPLASYLTAGSFLLFGQTALAARLPFALIGVATIALLLFWAYRATQEAKEAKANQGAARTPRSLAPDWLPMSLVALGVLGNVSLLLFCRQCRYYSPTVFFTLAVAFFYIHWRGTRGTLAWMAACSVLLFLSNYLNYLALYLCIALDYLLWRRKQQPLQVRDWLVLMLPQVLVCAPLAFIWNPLRTQFGGYVQQNSLGDKITLLFWQFRDLNRCEYLCGGLFLVGLGLALLGKGGVLGKDKWLLRGSCALAMYVALISVCSPQTVKLTSVADIRYLVPVIPLCIGLAARTIYLAAGGMPFIALGLGVIAFGTNLLNGGPLLWCGARSTIAQYVKELANPPADPYQTASSWLKANVKEGESIWTMPDYMAYPLMFHAPQAVYGWQLEATNHDPQFAKLPPIQFQCRVPPDYIVAFGPVVQQIRQMLPQWQGVRYEQVALLDCFWKDLYRPELFWRSFTPITQYNRESEAIYVFKKSP